MPVAIGQTKVKGLHIKRLVINTSTIPENTKSLLATQPPQATKNLPLFHANSRTNLNRLSKRKPTKKQKNNYYIITHKLRQKNSGKPPYRIKTSKQPPNLTIFIPKLLNIQKNTRNIKFGTILAIPIMLVISLYPCRI